MSAPLLALTLSLAAAVPRAQFDPLAAEPIARLRGGLVAFGGGELPEELPAAVLALLRGRERAVLGLVLARHGGGSEAAHLWIAAGFSEVVIHSPDSPRSKAFSPGFGDTLERADAVWIGELDPAVLAAAVRDAELAERLRAVIARGGVVCAAGRSAEMLGLPAVEGEPALSLLPGATVLAGYEAGRGAARVGALLAADPLRVVLAVEPDTALVLDERFFRALGAGAVRAFVAESEGRPRREDVIAGEARGDLIALSRSAQARRARPFPAAEQRAPVVERGSLVLAGGGELPDGLLERFVELAGGPDAPIVCVPCEYARELPREPGCAAELRAAGARNVTWIHTVDRAEADGGAELLETLRGARGIWFGGGRQWNLVDSYQHTEAHRLMEEVLASGGVIGGSSAGASIQADYLARGSPLGNREIMSEGYEEGLGFLRGVAIDQHFTQRGRGPELAALVRAYPQVLGIGLDEGAAIIVRSGEAEVLGAGAGRRVYFFGGRRAENGGGEQLWQAVEPGGRYDLARRAVVHSGSGGSSP